MFDVDGTLSEVDLKRVKSFLNPNVLELIVLPTEKCNFRCTYCYEDFAIGKMSPKVLNSLKQLIDERSKDLRVFQLSWFGGEPLIASDIVLDLSRFSQRICRENEIEFASNITTNGYLLTPDLLSDLVDADVRHYQVSIDGDQATHDMTRVLGSGAGTYDVIMNNLIAALNSKHEFRIILRLHITRQNIDGIERAFEQLNGIFGNDDRFGFFIKAIENLGGGADVKQSVPEKGDAKNMRSRIEALLAQNDPKDGAIDICYAARPNSFVIRADGGVGKCTVLFNSDSNKLGNLGRNGELDLDVEKLRRWMHGFETLDRAALHCPADALKMW